MMRWPAFLTALIATVSCLATDPAHAQRRPCGDGADIVAHLEKDWGEDPEVLALDASGRMVRILVNPETGTWTMLLTAPNGLTCLVSHGSAWEPNQPPPAPGDPS